MKIDQKTFYFCYDNTKIEDMTYKSSEFNITDVLTKIKTNIILLICTDKALFNDPVQQCTFREKSIIQLSKQKFIKNLI